MEQGSTIPQECLRYGGERRKFVSLGGVFEEVE